MERSAPSQSLASRYAFFIALAVLGFLIYSNTFHSGFVFDDHEGIENNPGIRSLSGFTSPSGTRYVAYLSFALNYAAGGLDVTGYHLVNTAIHSANAVLVYLLVSLIFKTPVMRGGNGRVDGAERFVGAAASLIFLTHPVATQAVAYMSQRIASLAALFYLLSAALYLNARLNAGPGAKGGLKAWASYTGAVVMAVAAQKTKETAFTLPFVIVFFEFVFFDNADGLKRRALRLLPFVLALPIIPLTILWGGGAQGAAAGGGASMAETAGRLMREELSVLSRRDYLMTEFRVLVTYLRLLFLPIGQNLDYDYPEFHSFSAPQVFLSFLFLAGIFVSSVYLLIRSRMRRMAHGIIIAVGVIWFFATISVESSVIPISDVIFEHRIYMPGIGIIIAFASALHLSSERLKLRPIYIWAVVAVISAVFSIATYRRNAVWTNELTLWRDVIRKSPQKPRAYSNMGYALARAGRPGEAVEYFEKFRALRPGFWLSYSNLGQALIDVNRPEEAVKEFARAIALKPGDYTLYNSMGEALLKAGRPLDAMPYFEKAVSLWPGFARGYGNIGFALADAGRPKEAVKYLGKAVEMTPGDSDAHNNLANALYMAGAIDDAISEYKKALALNPENANARRNLDAALSAPRPRPGTGKK